MRTLKLLIATILLTVGTMVANAQPGGMGRGGQRMDPEQMAKRRADMMKETVNLTADQYTKVVELYKAQNAEMQKMFQQGGQPQGGREAFEKMQQEQNAKLKTILTEEQFKKWTEAEQSRRSRMGGPGGPGGQGRRQ